MKQTIVALLATAALGGCVYQSVSHGDIEAASAFCSNYGGVNRLTSDFIGDVVAVCQDGRSSMFRHK